MAQAIVLARLGLYTTTPNPRVGCVLVSEGRVIGEGWHQVAGSSHAEINALAAVSPANKHLIQGATAYVTLEPCSHHGKTPPCADALITAGIKRLVYAMQDPNPLVAGKGLQRLREAGIAVAGPLLEVDAQELNPGFIKRMQTGLPWVCAKTASSLDGRTAMASGESQWITGTAARDDVQKMRARSCAIISGVGTVLQDDPALTVRDESLALAGTALRQPLRVIIDSQLRTPINAKVLHAPGKCLLVYACGNAEKLTACAGQNIETIQLANAQGKVDLHAVLAELGKRQCNEVMIEAGGKLLGAFLQEKLVDELVVYMAPTLLGDKAKSLAALPLDSMSQQIRMEVKELQAVGADYRWRLRPQYS